MSILPIFILTEEIKGVSHQIALAQRSENIPARCGVAAKYNVFSGISASLMVSTWRLHNVLTEAKLFNNAYEVACS